MSESTQTPNPDGTSEPSTEAPGGTPSSPEAQPTVSLTPEQLQASIQQATQAALEASNAQHREEMARIQQGTQQPDPPTPPVPLDDQFANIRDDDLIDGRTAKVMMQGYGQRMEGLVQGMQTLYGMGTSQLENYSKMEHKHEWEKYGKEIAEIINTRKQTKVLEPGDYTEAIEIVKGRHFHDYVEEKAQQMLSGVPTTEGVGDGGLTGMANDNIPQIPENYKAVLEDNGMSIKDVEEMVARRRAQGDNITVEKWLDMASKQQIVRDGPGKYVTENLTGGK